MYRSIHVMYDIKTVNPFSGEHFPYEWPYEWLGLGFSLTIGWSEKAAPVCASVREEYAISHQQR